MPRDKMKRSRSGAIKTIDDLRRRSPYKDRDLNRKIEQSNNRHKLLASMDPKTAEFARREFAKLGLF
jgi:hypothetical protein